MRKNKPVQSRTFIWHKLILIVLGVVLSLIILEVGLRLSRIVLLSLQERRNVTSIIQKGAYRIMCLGDSTTALGGKYSYPYQLQEILNQNNLGVKFSIINKGRIRIKTSYILEHLEENLDRYKPNMVITMMGIHDEYIRSYRDLPEVNATRQDNLLIFRFISTMWSRVVNKIYQNKIKNMNIYREDGHSHDADSMQDEDIFKEAIELNPLNEKAYAESGWFYKEQGKSIPAEEIFKKSIGLFPQELWPYVELGWCYKEQAKYTEAEEMFKKALEINPYHGWTLVSLGWCYKDQRRYAQAEEEFKKTISLNPENYWWVHLELGLCFKEQAKYAEAEEMFKKTLELNPQYYWAYAELSWCYEKEGKYSEAEQVFKKAIELNPNDDRAYAGLAALYQGIGKYEPMKEHYKRAAQLRSEYYNYPYYSNYLKLKEILDGRGVKLVCVQYPMRSIKPLKRIFEGKNNIVFVDNEKVFKDALRKSDYKEYFADIFAGDFGHCTSKGNRLLAENIAKVILEEYFENSNK